MHIYICIYIYLCIYIYICIYIYAYIYAYIYIDIHTYTPTYIHVYTYTRIHIYRADSAKHARGQGYLSVLGGRAENHLHKPFTQIRQSRLADKVILRDFGFSSVPSQVL